MKKRIYLVLETEADEDDKSIRSDIEQELGMATHYFEIVSCSENGFQDGWIKTKEKPPTKKRFCIRKSYCNVCRLINFATG